MQKFDVEKQFRFALASSLTATAKQAQQAVIRDIESTFTVRNSWLKPSNAMGVKVLPASKQDLSSAVVTRADWLISHETGKDKVPEGRHLAVPTTDVRRTKRQIIKSNQRPRALNSKNTFVLKTRRGGEVLFQRRGPKGKTKLVAMYRLIRRARIRKQSTFVEPVMKTVEKRFSANFEQKLRQALSTAKR